MGITVATMRAAVNTGTGTQDFTTSDLGGLTPVAVIAIITVGVTDGAVSANSMICIGAATGTSNEWSFAMQAEDAQITSDTDRSYSPNLVNSLSVGGAINAVGELDSFITNGVRINWTDAPPGAALMTLIFLAGTDLQAYAGVVDLLNTVDLETVISGLPFQPVDVFCVLSGTTTAAPVGSTAIISAGVAHDDGAGTTTQRSTSYRNLHNVGNVQVGLRYSSLYAAVNVAASGNVVWGAELDNFVADGFSVFTRIGGSGSNLMGYLALEYGGVAESFVGGVASPTSTGDDAETGPNFEPQFVMLGPSMAEALNTAYANANANSFGLSVITATAQFSNAIWDRDADTDTWAKSLSDDQAINIQNGVDGTGLAASFTSLDPTGFTLNYSDVEAAAKLLWVWAIEATAGVPSQFPPTISILQAVNRASTY